MKRYCKANEVRKQRFLDNLAMFEYMYIDEVMAFMNVSRMTLNNLAARCGVKLKYKKGKKPNDNKVNSVCNYYNETDWAKHGNEQYFNQHMGVMNGGD